MCVSVIYFVIFFCSTSSSSSSSLCSFSDRFLWLLSLSMRFLSLSLSLYLHSRCWFDCVDFACCRLAIDMLHVCERRAFQTFHLVCRWFTSNVYCWSIYFRLAVWIRIPLIRRKISRMHFYILRISKCIAFSKLENRFDRSVSFHFSFASLLRLLVLVAIMIVLWLLLSFAGHFFFLFFFIIIIDRAPIFTVNRSLFNLFLKKLRISTTTKKKNSRNCIAIVSFDLESTATNKGTHKKTPSKHIKMLEIFLVSRIRRTQMLSFVLFSAV